MKKLIALFIMAGFLFVAALAFAGDKPNKEAAADKKKVVHIKLQAGKDNIGGFGNAAFVATGKTCEVRFDISRLPGFIARPVHIYAFIYEGTCAKPGQKPVYEMNNTTLMYRTTGVGGDLWWVSKEIPASLSTLLAGKYVVVVRSTPADGNYDLFCADIR